MQLILINLALTVVLVASKEGFLEGPSAATVNRLSRDEAFQQALGTVMGMGCGNDFESSVSLARIEEVLTPMWRSLPKNTYDRVEWRMLRYLAHRYFMKSASLLIRGFEPSRSLNASHIGAADILHQKAPSLVEMMLEGKEQTQGFTLKDAVAMVGTLEQLMLDSEQDLLDLAYEQQRRSVTQTLDHDEFFKVIESYLVHWMVEGDANTARIMLRNRTLLAEGLPNWHSLEHYAVGVAKSFEHNRLRAPQAGHAQVTMTQRFSFEDAHEAVGAITKGFASFWEAQCQDIKSSLVALDKRGTGRIPLKDFYGANADGEWRFGESEAYLRELGALDESVSFTGPQVIIPNYLLGASNCIVSAEHYLVCCVNECEDILNEIEDTVRGPVATPDEIVRIVQSMSSFQDVPVSLGSDLKTQLRRLAETNGGKIPLHGRLFAQWLHYVFPRECSFPHKTGAISSASLGEFGAASLASDEEVRTHAAKRGQTSDQMHRVEEEQTMSLWSEEEELIVDYSQHLRAPWESRSRYHALGGVAVGAIALAIMFSGALKGSNKAVGPDRIVSGFESKSHFV